ncbi:unnamed protein product [Prunus armeniaca]
MLDFMISGTLLLEESNIGEQVMKTSLNIDMHPGNATKLGDQNQNGILWYVPKAPSDMLNDFPHVEGFAYCTFCGRRFSHNQLMRLFNHFMTKIEKNVILSGCRWEDQVPTVSTTEVPGRNPG